MGFRRSDHRFVRRRFKLIAWLCLNADRHTGRIRITEAELAQILGRSEGEIPTASEELLQRGVCCLGTGLGFEIADRYWPYEKQSCQSAPREYVAQVRKILSEPACVRCRFKAADEHDGSRAVSAGGVAVAGGTRDLARRGRKYATLLSAPGAPPMPIASLRYFTAVIDEVVAHSRTSDSYWSYIRRKAAGLEQEWLRSSRNDEGSAGT